MTRPRSYQLNDPNERFTRIPFKSTPAVGSYSTTFTGSDYNAIVNASSTGSGPTGSITGSSHDLPASIVGTGCEYPSGISLTPGNQFTVVVNGTPTLITLQVSDFSSLNKTSVSRLVNRINLTTGKQIASRVDVVGGDAALKLTSDTTGSASSIQLLPAGPSGLSVLQAMGFGPSVIATASGSNASRGIITKSLDGLGGKLYLNRADGYSLTANSNTFYRLPRTNYVYADNQYTQGVVPGSRVFARLTTDQTVPSFRVSYKSKVLTHVRAISKGNNFNAITSSPLVEIELTDLTSGYSIPFTTILPNAPTSVSQVVDAFNSSWASATGNNTARVISRNTGPFYPSANVIRTITLAVDGVNKPVVTLTDDMTTLGRIGAAINLQTSTSIATVANNKLVLTSPTSGPTSSIEVIDIEPELSKQLGIVRGVYCGYNICYQNGCEIEFKSPWPSARMRMIGWTPGVLSLLGFNNSDYPYSSYSGNEMIVFADETTEYDVPFPHLPENTGVNEPNYVIGMFPEYEELGDVPNDQFAKERDSDYDSDYKHLAPTSDPSGYRAGGTITANDLGMIDASVSPYAVPSGKVGGVSFPSVRGISNWPPNPLISTDRQYLYTGIIESRNPGDSSVKVSVEDGPSGPELLMSSNLNVPSGVSFYNQVVGLENASQDASVLSLGTTGLSLRLKSRGASTWDLNTWTPTLLVKGVTGITSVNYSVSVNNDTIISGNNGPLLLSDSVIQANADNVDFYPLSGPTGANALRVSNREARSKVDNHYSLIKSLNARHTIVCGDGVNTFGDFNGTSALADAADFITANNINNVTIVVKKGSYGGTTPISFSRGNVEIVGHDASVPPLEFSSNNLQSRFIKLGGLRVNNDGYKSLSVDDMVIEASQCIFLGDVRISLPSAEWRNNSLSVAYDAGFSSKFSNCYLQAYPTAGNACVRLTSANNAVRGPVIFDGCVFDNAGSVNIRCLHIQGQMNVSTVLFNGCSFKLASYTASGNYMAYNTGLIELDPTNNGRTANGLTIQDLVYKDCIVDASNANGLNMLLQLAPHLTSSSQSANYGHVNRTSFIRTNFSVLTCAASNANQQSCFVVGCGTDELILEDCTLHILNGSGVYGFMPKWFTDDIINEYWNLPVSGNHSQNANVVLSAEFIRVKNFKILDSVRLSNHSGLKNGNDIMVASVDRTDVDGVYIQYKDGGGGSYPRFRFTHVQADPFTPTLSSPVKRWLPNTKHFYDIKNVHFGAPSSYSSDAWCDAFIYNETNYSNISGCCIYGFNNNGNAALAGILLEPDLTRVRIENCEIRDVTLGIIADGNLTESYIHNNLIRVQRPGTLTVYPVGIRILCDQVFGTEISSNRIYVTTTLYFSGTSATRSVFLTTPAGIMVATSYGSDFVIRNIKVLNNYISVSNIQIPTMLFAPYIPASAGNLNDVQPVVATGNITHDSGGNTVAFINAFKSDSSNPAKLTSYSTTVESFFPQRSIGLETSIQWASGSGGANYMQYGYSNGVSGIPLQTLGNAAWFKTGNTP